MQKVWHAEVFQRNAVAHCLVSTFHLSLSLWIKSATVAQKVFKTTQGSASIEENYQERQGKDILKEGAYNIARGTFQNLPIISSVVSPVFLTYDLGLLLAPETTKGFTKDLSRLL